MSSIGDHLTAEGRRLAAAIADQMNTPGALWATEALASWALATVYRDLADDCALAVSYGADRSGTVVYLTPTRPDLIRSDQDAALPVLAALLWLDVANIRLDRLPPLPPASPLAEPVDRVTVLGGALPSGTWERTGTPERTTTDPDSYVGEDGALVHPGLSVRLARLVADADELLAEARSELDYLGTLVDSAKVPHDDVYDDLRDLGERLTAWRSRAATALMRQEVGE